MVPAAKSKSTSLQERNKCWYLPVVLFVAILWILYLQQRYLDTKNWTRGLWMDTEETENVDSSSSKSSSGSVSIPDPQSPDDWATLKVMTWNLQGLKQDKIVKRTEAVISTVLREKPDAIFFQELVTSSYNLICKALQSDYECIHGRHSKTARYYVGILFKKSRFKVEDRTKIPFTNSVMDRLLLIVKLYVLGPVKARVVLMTSHLESLPKFARAREEQLLQSFRIGSSYSVNYSVIFGGDLNLEDGEGVGMASPNFKDLWEECGSPEMLAYTWDSTVNHNEPADNDEQKPRTRYDRLYFRPSNPKMLHLTNLDLVGTEKVEGTNFYPSDHWGLLSTFKVSTDGTKYSCGGGK